MADIFEEAKHELQQEKLHLIIRRHYKGVIAFIALVLIAIFLYVYLKEKNIKKQEKLSEEYYTLFIAKGKIGKIKESDFGKLAAFETSIYLKFAKLQYVNSLVQIKEYNKALQLLFNTIETSKKESEISNLAKIKAAEIVMKYKVETYNDKVLDILRKATRKSDAPYFYVLKLLLGQLLIESGKQEEARGGLKDMSKDNQTPSNIKFLSNAILENYLE